MPPQKGAAFRSKITSSKSKKTHNLQRKIHGPPKVNSLYTDWFPVKSLQKIQRSETKIGFNRYGIKMKVLRVFKISITVKQRKGNPKFWDHPIPTNSSTNSYWKVELLADLIRSHHWKLDYLSCLRKTFVQPYVILKTWREKTYKKKKTCFGCCLFAIRYM